MAVFAVIVLAVVPALALVLGLVTGDRERVEHYYEVATLGSDQGPGRASVTEVIDYDFGAGNDRHGIFRVVPGLLEGRVTVSSPTAPDDVDIVGSRIRIGDPDVTVTGTHRYTISYRLDTLVSGSAAGVERGGWRLGGADRGRRGPRAE